MSKCTLLLLLVLLIAQLSMGFHHTSLRVQTQSPTALSMGFFSRFRRNKAEPETHVQADAAAEPVASEPVVPKPVVVGDEISAYWNRPGPWDDRNLDSLLTANKAWANRMKSNDPMFFEEHKKGHAPKILWIGCSDARVPANEMIGEPPGSVFVHRNIANQVVQTDFNCMSVIQYAVDVLEVKHIIVCGHYDCGGVKAALTNLDHKSPLENWLRNIRDTYRLHKDELDAIKDLKGRQRKLVELNVVEQCLNIFKTAVVQKKRVETHFEALEPGSDIPFSTPVIHAFVYEPTTGEATKLKVDFKQYLTELHDIYDLYKMEKEEPTTQLPTTMIQDKDGNEECVTQVLTKSLSGEGEGM